MKRLMILAGCTVLLALSAAGSAFASAAPLATGDVEVQFWPGVKTGEVLVIVGVTLPENVPLPATVRLPVPPGSEVTWAGEIGGDATNDVAVEPRIAKGKGADYAEFELRTQRRGQIELSGIVYEQDGTAVSAEIDYVQAAPAKVTGFAVRVPATASDLRIEPAPSGEPDRNEAGEYLYTLPSKEMKEGEKSTIRFSYDTALPRAQAPMSSTSVLMIVLGSLVGLAVIALILLLRRQSARPSAASDDDEDPSE